MGNDAEFSLAVAMFKILTSTLPDFPDPAVAIAGSRAGALGILDLTLCSDASEALASLRKLSCHAAGGGIGVRFRVAGNEPLLEQVSPFLPANISTIILVPLERDHLTTIVTSLKSNQRQILLECISPAEAECGVRSGVDGLIAKGSEAGGRVGDDTTYILLQKICAAFSLPVLAHGGIGPHTAASCLVAGAAGVVLDSQLVFTREFRTDTDLRKFLSTQDGSRALGVGEEIGEKYRILPRPGSQHFKSLLECEQQFHALQETDRIQLREWRRKVQDLVLKTENGDGGRELFFIGQELSFARGLADTFVTVGGIVQAIRESVERHYSLADAKNPFDAGGALAQSHGTEYAIVQGPMARISDSPEFAKVVAENGALPFLAAAWSRPEDLDVLLGDTARKLDGFQWGVGLLGFLPPEVYAGQLAVVVKHRPSFALLAGGRPDQVSELAKHGISTYVHVPTANLLSLFLEAGVKRFVFEGREAGGHVGPFNSFVLWETMIQCLLDHAQRRENLAGIHVLFAGGIHDAVSSAMIAVMASPLLHYGASVGLQVGSAYLFTREVVASGAMLAEYQNQIRQCTATTVIQTGPGHAVRCVETPFVSRFQKEKRRLFAEKYPPGESREVLEEMVKGRLRIAAKGLLRTVADSSSSGAGRLTEVDASFQVEEGNYVIGQIAGLRSEITTIAALHRELAVNGYDRLVRRIEENASRISVGQKQKPADIAVIGMAGFFPGAADVNSYWNNILHDISQIREIPKERWDYRVYFNEEKDARDRIYAKWGTFLNDIPFDPIRYGMPPMVVPSVEPLHLMTLEAVRLALDDAGYGKRPFKRDKTAVLMGISGVGELAQMYGFRTLLPMFFGSRSVDIVEHFNKILPEWTEDSFPGILMNVAAGRIANRFDFGGMNALVDGACASSLAALYAAVKELETGACDMAVVGGADCMQNPFTYMCFSKTQALSPRGVCNCLDAKADGIVIGEAVVSVILKRVADAERDGDRIYGVIKGMGASSDGRDRSLTAPGIEGQARALRRAYAKAGGTPADVELFEAHATGTVEGDKIEVEALTKVLNESQAEPYSCAIGSVKSMIGHSKSAAGLASLVKAVKALHHRVLPPTSGVDTPNPGLQRENSPLYANSQTRPWFSSRKSRRAGVSAFGFGGTNYHAVIEEYQRSYYDPEPPASYQSWGTEMFQWQSRETGGLLALLQQELAQLKEVPERSLARLSFANLRTGAKPSSGKGEERRFAVVAATREDLIAKLVSGITMLEKGVEHHVDPRGVFFTCSPMARRGKTAFLFPGQGSQYINMLVELTVQFPWIMEQFSRSSEILADRISRPLTSYIFPRSVFTEHELQDQGKLLADTVVAQPAMGSADLSMYHLCHRLGVEPDMVAGHSYGELVALCAAGVMSDDELIALSEARAGYILKAAGEDPGTMAAVAATVDIVEKVVALIEGVWIANINGPEQVVITGTRSAIEEAVAGFEKRNISARPIPVSCAFHSPLIAAAGKDLETHLLEAMDLKEPRLPVYSNTTAVPHSNKRVEIAATLAKHVVNRVRFSEQVLNMYRDGARIFVECGPNRILTGLVAKILEGKPFVAVAMNQKGRSSLTQLQHALAELFVNGIDVNFEPLFRGRCRGDGNTAEASLTPTTWLLNGSRARPVQEKEKPLEVKPFDFPRLTESITPEAIPTYRRQCTESASVCAGNVASDDAVIGFQRLMRKFLDTQGEVMSRYLGRQGVADGGAGDRLEPVPPQNSGEIAGEEGVRQESAVPASEDKEPVAAEKPGAVDPAEQLLKIVCERTGYPREMLGLDSDLEADLGIDSIKRVEILGAFLRLLSPKRQKAEQLTGMEGVRTLRQILDRVGENVSIGPGAAVDATTVPPEVLTLTNQDQATAHQDTSLARCLVIPKQSKISKKKITLTAGKTIIITDDGLGVAELLADRFLSRQLSVIIIRLGEAGQSAKWIEYSLKELGESGLASTIGQVHDTIGGVIHLLPLQLVSSFGITPAMDLYQEGIRILKPLFYLLQAVEQDLRKDGDGIVATVTSLGGKHGFGNAQADSFCPVHGVLTGFMKTIAVEWPETHVKVIDFELPYEASALADTVFAEITCADDRIEVGWVGDDRFELSIQFEPVPENAPNETVLHQDSVVLVTGGARGITSGIALEMARRYQPTLVLVGRSPIPESEEDGFTAHRDSAREIKLALIERAKAENRDITIPEVETACRRILAARDIRTSLKEMRNAGSRVVYESLDVSDTRAFSALIRRIHDRYGRLDGVVHGAGTIEDKLFSEKSWESFERVFSTKVLSTFTLAQALHGLAPRFVVFFSSVAGIFGNRGQCDYAAANEVMNKTALLLDHEWPGRVVSLNWGPWAGSGMATEMVQEQFRKRGVPLIDRAPGIEAFMQELRLGKGGGAVVLLGDGPWVSRMNATDKNVSLPLLMNKRVVQRFEDSVSIELTLDVNHHRYLEDHQLDGRPVFPAAMAIELMAEAGSFFSPEKKVSAVRDVRVLKGIGIDGKPQELAVLVKPEGMSGSQQTLNVKIMDPGSSRVFYSGKVEMTNSSIAAPDLSIPQFSGADHLNISCGEMYEKWLFHGPIFQCITENRRLCAEGMQATIRTSTPRKCLAGDVRGSWLIDPVVLDGGFQLALVWGRFQFDITMLPAHVGAVHVYEPFPLSCHLSCVLEVAEIVHQQCVRYNIYFTGEQGQLVSMVEGFEVVGSRDLNRLIEADVKVFNHQ